MQLEISTLEEKIQFVKLAGRLDMKGANEIDNQFSFAVGADPAPTLVDLSEVEFLASIGMRLLISTARAKANRGSQMALLKPTPMVKEALMTAGFEPLIPIFEDLDTAIAALQPA